MRLFLRSAIVLFLSVAAFGQTNDPAMDQEVFDKPLRSSYIPLGPGDKMLSVLDLDGCTSRASRGRAAQSPSRIRTRRTANQTLPFTLGTGGGGGMEDGVIVGASYDSLTRMVTLTTSFGTMFFWT